MVLLKKRVHISSLYKHLYVLNQKVLSQLCEKFYFYKSQIDRDVNLLEGPQQDVFLAPDREGDI